MHTRHSHATLTRIGHAVLKLATAPGFGLIPGKFLSPKADAIVLPEY